MGKGNFRALAELGTALLACGAKLILCGGSGLFVWQMEEEASSSQKIIAKSSWCAPREINDVDILLETSIVADLTKFEAVAQILNQLGYTAIQGTGVEFMHFEKIFANNERTELNFLTGPIVDEKLAAQIKVTRPRVRPKGRVVGLHAFLTREAIGFCEKLKPIKEVASNPIENLYVPSAMTFLVMKMHAFFDQFQKGKNEKASVHAIDVYRIICMFNDDTLAETKDFLNSHRDNDVLRLTTEIAKEYFVSEEQQALAMIRESSLFRLDFDLGTMCTTIAVLFQDCA